MIWFVVFLCVMFYGLGYCTNFIISNIRELDKMIERRRKEDEEFANKYKQSVQQITVDLIANKSDSNTGSLKAAVKSKH